MIFGKMDIDICIAFINIWWKMVSLCLFIIIIIVSIGHSFVFFKFHEIFREIW